MTNGNTFSRILDTDYSTYFVEYSCTQSLLDIWTIEYIDIFTKDGTLDPTTLATIKTNLGTWAPNFNTDNLVTARTPGQCAYEAVWFIF